MSAKGGRKRTEHFENTHAIFEVGDDLASGVALLFDPDEVLDRLTKRDAVLALDEGLAAGCLGRLSEATDGEVDEFCANLVGALVARWAVEETGLGAHEFEAVLPERVPRRVHESARVSGEGEKGYCER